MFFNDGDDNWNSTANLCVYEKQPLIGAVHELIGEFCDDILTIFPYINQRSLNLPQPIILLLKLSSAARNWSRWLET